MAVKTIRLRQGENFYEFAERKFGDRSIGNTLIRQFGRGRAGVQYRFRTSLSTSKKAVAGRRQRVATDFAQQQELVTPEIVSEGTAPILPGRPQPGTEAFIGMGARLEAQRATRFPTAIDDRPGDLGQRAREAEEGIRTFLQQQEFAALSPQEQALARQEKRFSGSGQAARLERARIGLRSQQAREQQIATRTQRALGPGSLAQQAREQQIATRTQRALGLGPATGTAGLVDPFAVLAQSMAQEPRNPAFQQELLQPTGDGQIRPDLTEGRAAQLATKQAREEQIATRTQRALGLVPPTGTAGLGDAPTQQRAPQSAQDGQTRPTDISGREEQMAGVEQRVLSNVGGLQSTSEYLVASNLWMSQLASSTSQLSSSGPTMNIMTPETALALGFTQQELLDAGWLQVERGGNWIDFAGLTELMVANDGMTTYANNVFANPGFTGKSGGGGGGGSRTTTGSTGFTPSTYGLVNWRTGGFG